MIDSTSIDLTDAGLRQSLDKQQGFLNALLENVEDGIVACDAEGILTVFNHAAREFHGLLEEPIPAERWAEHYDLYLPDGKTLMGKEDVPLFRALRGEHVRNLEMVIAPKKGPSRTVLVSGRAIRNDEGEMLGAVVVMRDFTELKATQEALIRESNVMQALLDNIPDAIYFKDCEGRFTRVNRHAPYRGNKSPEEVVGKTDYDFFVEDHARAAYEDEQRVIGTGLPITDKEEKETYPDGSITWLSTTKAPIFDEAGRVTGIVGISRDITERKLAEEARLELVREQAARKEAEAASRSKDEFLATLSHELRTPLTAIYGWGQMLIEGLVDEDKKAWALETMVRNAHAQARLVDDLLDVSRIITGRFHINARPVEVRPLVEASVDGVRPAAEAKGIFLSTLLGRDVGVVSGDPDRLQQVLWNLLSNAVKFTPPGGRVEVELRRAGRQAVVRVSDTGRGIAPAFLPHAFERFRQAEQSTTRQYGGLGLGLAIVRHLVELHGGSVRAESEGEGRGATFTVELPLETAASPSAGFEDAAPTLPGAMEGWPPSLEDTRVLLVEDDDDAREMLCRLLERLGARVTATASAAEAWEALETAAHDVLVSDIGMSGEDGYSLVRRLRAREAETGGELPAVALTAYAGDEDRARALVAGFNAHVPKPVNPVELVAVVAGLAGRGQVVNDLP
jgi:PAS domain S-box-containing protein